MIRGRKDKVATLLGMLHALNNVGTGCHYNIVIEKYTGNYGNGWSTANNNTGAVPGISNPQFDYSIHVRSSMPCWGELRKYRSTHPTEATTENGKPGDLWHPLPMEGQVAALGLPWLHKVIEKKLVLKDPENNKHLYEMNPDGTYKYDDVPFTDEFRELQPFMVKEMWGDESPFVTGFGGADNVEFTWHDGAISGFVLKDTQIDSTVLVHFLRKMGQFWGAKIADGDNSWRGYKKARDAGATVGEAMLLMYINGGVFHKFYNGNGHPISIKAWDKKQPRDLTGGTMADGFDYNRTQLDEVYRVAPEFSGKVTLWGKYHQDNGFVYNYSDHTNPGAKLNCDIPTLLDHLRKFMDLNRKSEPEPDWDYRLITPTLPTRRTPHELYPTTNPRYLANTPAEHKLAAVMGEIKTKVA